jgi:hypothetical protein
MKAEAKVITTANSPARDVIIGSLAGPSISIPIPTNNIITNVIKAATRLFI